MATSEKIPIKPFLESVRRHPEIWAPTPSSGRRRVAAAWKRVCLDVWPDFGSWTSEQKQMRCLELQAKWKSVREEFVTAHENGTPSRRSAYSHILSFLIPANSPSGSGMGVEAEAVAVAGGSGTRPGPVKRVRFEVPEDSPNPDDQEDRHFLLSLVSYMRDVPRASKLALREDMLRLLRKYIPTANGDVLNAQGQSISNITQQT